MEKKDCIVKTSVAPLYSKPTFKSELITQALIWEYLIILDKKNNWYKIKQWDNYISWIHNSYIVDSDIYIKKSRIEINMPFYDPTSQIDYNFFIKQLHRYTIKKGFYNKLFHTKLKNQLKKNYRHTLNI